MVYLGGVQLMLEELGIISQEVPCFVHRGFAHFEALIKAVLFMREWHGQHELLDFFDA